MAACSRGLHCRTDVWAALEWCGRLDAHGYTMRGLHCRQAAPTTPVLFCFELGGWQQFTGQLVSSQQFRRFIHQDPVEVASFLFERSNTGGRTHLMSCWLLIVKCRMRRVMWLMSTSVM